MPTQALRSPEFRLRRPDVDVRDPEEVGAPPLRVLLVTESFVPTINGVTNSVVRTVRHLRDRGHAVVLLAPGDGPETFEGCQVHRVRAVNPPFYPSLPVGLPERRRIRAVLNDLCPDVVHVAAPVGLGAVALAESRPYPTVATFQTDLAGFARSYRLSAVSPAFWKWTARVHKLADVTVAPSSASAADLERRGVHRVRVVPRGVDHALFRPARRCEELNAWWRRDGGDVVCGYVGRLAREKRVEDLAVLDGLPGVQTVIIGDGPARRDLERRLPNARFAGMLRGEELARAVASLDMVVNPGQHETFCQVIQEAMASGVPVIAPACGGPLDLIEHGATGLLYPPSEPTQIRTMAGVLARSEEIRFSMSAAARHRVSHRTWAAVGDQLLDVYRTVLQLRRAVR